MFCLRSLVERSSRRAFAYRSHAVAWSWREYYFALVCALKILSCQCSMSSRCRCLAWLSSVVFVVAFLRFGDRRSPSPYYIHICQQNTSIFLNFLKSYFFNNLLVFDKFLTIILDNFLTIFDIDKFLTISLRLCVCIRVRVRIMILAVFSRFLLLVRRFIILLECLAVYPFLTVLSLNKRLILESHQNNTLPIL